MKHIKKNQSTPRILKEKSARKSKIRKISERKTKSEDLKELARTWDEDLCE